MKIKNKMELQGLLYNEDYNFIAFYDNGSWTRNIKDSDTLFILQRCNFYDKTHKEIQEKIKELELEIDRNFPF